MSIKLAKGFLYVLSTTIFTALGQIFFNLASNSFEFSFQGIILNPFIWVGFIAYGFGLLILVFGLRDGELTSLFPVLSLSYIWVLIASVVLFKEPLTLLKITGTLIITAGVAIIGISSKGFKVKQNG